MMPYILTQHMSKRVKVEGFMLCTISLSRLCTWCMQQCCLRPKRSWSVWLWRQPCTNKGWSTENEECVNRGRGKTFPNSHDFFWNESCFCGEVSFRLDTGHCLCLFLVWWKGRAPERWMGWWDNCWARYWTLPPDSAEVTMNKSLRKISIIWLKFTPSSFRLLNSKTDY